MRDDHSRQPGVRPISRGTYGFASLTPPTTPSLCIVIIFFKVVEPMYSEKLCFSFAFVKRGVKGELCSPYIYEFLRVFTLCFRNLGSTNVCRRNCGFGSPATPTQQRNQRRGQSNEHPSREGRILGTGLPRRGIPHLASRTPI